MKSVFVFKNLVLVLFLIMMQHNASAFSVPKVPGLGGGGVDVDSLLAAQGDVVKTLSSSLRNLTAAQILMAEALGLKEEAASARELSSSLESGDLSGKDDIKKAVSNSVSTQEKINSTIAEGAVLSAESKLQFGKSLLPYGKGSFGMVKTGQKAKAQAESVSQTKNPMVLRKVGTLLYVAKNTPKLLKTFSGSTKALLKFARSNGIDTSDIESEMDLMGD